ncbi:MAG: MATE family efflux transporter [Pseudomonadales bacterium]
MTTAVFTKGSTLRHVLTMTAANAIGLITVFTVDLVDMYFLSLLGQEELAAAIGFSGTLLFFLTSVSIGMLIAMGALVSRAEGMHNRALAGRYCSNVLLFSLLISLVMTFFGWLFLEELLRFLGARGKTLELAMSYANILLPSTPILAVGMACAAALRALGDARLSMWATVGAALVNACLDPIFIFVLGWGIEGAAVASVLARVAIVVIAFHGIVYKHHLPTKTNFRSLWQDLPAIMPIAGPAMLTNLATPIGSSFVLITMARFGDSAVAGSAILGRLAPVAFAAIFALSGAIGPIIGQNAGNGRYDRVRRTLLDAQIFNMVYILLVWGVLWAISDMVIASFNATGDAEMLIRFYIQWLVPGFLFTGMMFISNASFNNLNKAHFATVFNFCRVALGTVPLVLLFSGWWGAVGVMAGEIFSGIVFGILSFSTVLWHIRKLDAEHRKLDVESCVEADTVQWAFSSPRAQLSGVTIKDDEKH